MNSEGCDMAWNSFLNGSRDVIAKRKKIERLVDLPGKIVHTVVDHAIIGL
jgi:hypothetical protein